MKSNDLRRSPDRTACQYNGNRTVTVSITAAIANGSSDCLRRSNGLIIVASTWTNWDSSRAAIAERLSAESYRIGQTAPRNPIDELLYPGEQF